MDPFVAEIRLFACNFAPTGWATCDGQLLPISQNTALFSLLGTFYGGDGKSTFALPDLGGRAPLQQGQGQGLSIYALGQAAGADATTLLESEIPGHIHQVQANALPGDLAGPSTTRSLARSSGDALYTSGTTAVPLAATALAVTGAGQDHTNMQPYLTLLYCIALQGIFPQRP
jgi:microcystin-dependent protein